MKLEDSLPSSSSRRDQTSPAPEKLRAKRIGCMSALFRLVYNYHNRRRRFLTSGKKQERNIAKTVLASTTNPKQTASPLQQQKPQNGVVSAKHDPVIKTSCGLPRSPTLPPDMRRARPPVGMNDHGIPERGSTAVDPATEVEEKRRRLLGALEKCDEDLKTLKKIIEVVKSSVAANDDDYDSNNQNNTTSGAIKSDDIQFSTASSAIHHVTCRSTRHIANVVGRMPQQQKKKPGEEEKISNMCFYDRVMSPLDQVLMGNIHGKSTVGSNYYSPNSLWTSKAMVASVNEVCKDIEWGEKREIGRICLALQDHICRDLIEEFVGDEVLGFKFGCKLVTPPLPLPFESCKKRLQF